MCPGRETVSQQMNVLEVWLDVRDFEVFLDEEDLHHHHMFGSSWLHFVVEIEVYCLA
jgi:hypothetical protein